MIKPPSQPQVPQLRKASASGWRRSPLYEEEVDHKNAPQTGGVVCHRRKLALAFPDVQEGSSYGTPGFKVRGKFMLRLKEDGESLAVRVGSIEERDMMLQADPRVFFITDHYQNYPAVLVRLATATVPKFASCSRKLGEVSRRRGWLQNSISDLD